MKIATIIGARPQFIKAAVLSRLFTASKEVDEITIHTGQHYDETLSDIFFAELDMPLPHYNLGVRSGSHGAQTGRMLERIEAVLIEERPGYVLVYGDTNSTLAGALAAAKLGFAVAHVEAGLRSFNRAMPEEINRVLTDHLADLLFAPTDQAVAHLRKEGLPDDNIFLVGDIMYDSVLYNRQKALSRSNILTDLQLEPNSYILATVHRAENTDNHAKLAVLVKGLIAAAEATNLSIIWPIHPRTRKAISDYSISTLPANGLLRLIDPISYLDMLALEQNARVIATDSGGIQKEAFIFKVPCITLREETEWVELLNLGWNQLAPPRNEKLIKDALISALKAQPISSANPYGDGSTGQKILKILLKQAGYS